MALTNDPATSLSPSLNRLVSLQMGAMSPLWMTFTSMAAVGAATWSMTRWMRMAAPAAQTLTETFEEILTPASAAPTPVAEAPVAEAPVVLAAAAAPALVETAPIQRALAKAPAPKIKPDVPAAAQVEAPVVKAAKAPIVKAARKPAASKAKPAAAPTIAAVSVRAPVQAKRAAKPASAVARPIDGRTKAGRAAKAAAALKARG